MRLPVMFIGRLEHVPQHDVHHLRAPLCDLAATSTGPVQHA